VSTRKASRAPGTLVTVSIQLTVTEATALANGVFTCTSATAWREAQRALAAVQQATAERLKASR
jgi:hypothetical protein